MKTIGDQFPNYSLTACVSCKEGSEFATIKGDTYANKWRVVFFWPMDFTFVCPTEIAEFGNASAEMAKKKCSNFRMQY